MSGQAALDELRAALAKRGNVKLLTLLAAAEGALRREDTIARRGRPRVTYERLSPAGYWPDGTMSCPCQDIPGETACDYHDYSGCFFDETTGTEGARRG